ncbi:MAG TPA: hypothetical protein VIN40_10750 [Candidatus Tyrphobacter sp.]
MRMDTCEKRPICEIGYAADDRGRGVVYARVRRRGGERVLRLAFRIERCPGLGDREVGYAALSAIAPLIRKQVAEIVFEVGDADLVDDLTRRRDLPVPLMLPYIRARCALNAFESYALKSGADANDLAARALAEVTIRIAA